MKSFFDYKTHELKVNGVKLSVLLEGKGPLVILLHGFPQCSFLWRHQIAPLVKSGYKVAIPDQRGYGKSDAPKNITEYTVTKLANDVAAIAKELKYEKFIVIGQDWGAPVAWYTALLHDKSCKAVMGMSVPSARPEEWSAWLNHPYSKSGFWYINYFQQLKIPELLIEAELRKNLSKIYAALSASTPRGTWLNQSNYSKSYGLTDVLPDSEVVSDWLTREELDFYVTFFRKQGLRGPINWYRAISLNHSETKKFQGKRIIQPAAFIAGADDDVLGYGGADNQWYDSMDSWFADLRFKSLIADAGHWLQCEKPEETTEAMLKFLAMVK